MVIYIDVFCFRYYVEEVPDLPSLLRPRSISHIHGLRTRVIRALYYVYPPFQLRVKSIQPFERDPDLLKGARCVLQWHQKVKTSWYFYFKFYFPNVPQCYLSKKPNTDEDELLAELDVFSNSEENCSVLRVSSPNFISLPVVMGQVLTKSSISVGHRMQYHKLRLYFNAEFNARQQLTSGTSLVMDPVVNLQINQWWDPKYPYNTTQ